jgi:gamma-glutamylputrescine oxidase
MQPSYWESITPTPASGPQTFPEKTDFLIVGAGFCGSWLAYFIKKKNPSAQILILERSSFGQGASTKNAGFLSPGNISEWNDDIQAHGWDACLETLLARIEGLRIVKEEFGSTLKITDISSADFDAETPEKIDLMTRFNKDLGQEVFKLKKLSFAGDEQNFIASDFGSAINPVQLLGALHEKLRKAGVQIVFNTDVKRVMSGKAVLSNSEIEYNHAFLCTNAFAKNLNPQSVVNPARGQVIVTKPCDLKNVPDVLGFKNQGYDYFRRVDGNRFLYGGGRHLFKEHENIESFETTPEIRDYLMGEIASVLSHKNFEIECHWAGIMGNRAGGHVSAAQLLTPAMIDTKTEEIAGFSGWGVTLTPFAAKKKAEKL